MHPYAEALFSLALPSHPNERREEIILAGGGAEPTQSAIRAPFPATPPAAMVLCARQEPALAGVEGRLVYHLDDTGQKPSVGRSEKVPVAS